MVFVLLLQSAALGGKLLAPIGEFLQAEDPGLVGGEAAPGRGGSSGLPGFAAAW